MEANFIYCFKLLVPSIQENCLSNTTNSMTLTYWKCKGNEDLIANFNPFPIPDVILDVDKALPKFCTFFHDFIYSVLNYVVRHLDMYKEYFSNNPLRHHSANFRCPTSPFPTEQSLLLSLAFGLGEMKQIPFQHPGPVQISGSHLFKSQAAGVRKLTFSTCADPPSGIPNFIPAEGRLHPRPSTKERNDGIFHFPSTELQHSPSLSLLLLASSVTIKNTWFVSLVLECVSDVQCICLQLFLAQYYHCYLRCLWMQL